MRKYAPLCIFILLAWYPVKAQKKQILNTVFRAYLMNEDFALNCECALKKASYKSDCPPLDSVKISLYINERLIGTTYTDTDGHSTDIKLAPNVYTIIFQKQGYVSDTITVNLMDIQYAKITSANDTWQPKHNTNGAVSDIVIGNTYYACARMIARKSGVRIISKSR